MDSFVPKVKCSKQNSTMYSKYTPESWFSFDGQPEMQQGPYQSHFNIQPTYYQPPPKMVWNATKHIYENIPVMQHSASFPLVPCPYGMMAESSFQETYPPEPLHKYPPIQHQQQQQPNLERLWNVACDFAENFLVQMFCDQTKISEETLAKSKLNPNAKEFTPMMYAEKFAQQETNRALDKIREDFFSPKGGVSPNIGIPNVSSMQKKECIPLPSPSPTIEIPRMSSIQTTESIPNPFPTVEIARSPRIQTTESIPNPSPTVGIARSPSIQTTESITNPSPTVGIARSTSIHTTESISSKSPTIGIPRIETMECIPSPVPSLTSVMNRKATPWRKNSQQHFTVEDEMLSISFSSGASSFTETGSLDSFCGTRTKCISESSDDFHIKFEEDNNSCCDKANLGQNIHNLIYEDSDLSSDDDDDDDWDEGGDYDSAGGSGFCVELDEDESKELMMSTFSCPLFQSNLVCATSVEGHPSSIKASSSILDEANKRWMEQFQSSTFIALECHPRAVIILSPVLKSQAEHRNAKTVSWKPEGEWEVILEPEELVGDLKEARVSDYERRNACKERLEKSLAPILQPKHRAKIYERLYGGKLD